MGKLKVVSYETKEILKKLNKEYSPIEITNEVEKPKLNKFNIVSF